MTDIENL